MSYTRFAYRREHTFGTSNLYSYIESPSGNLRIIPARSRCSPLVEKEDVFEMVLSILRCSKIKLTKTQKENLAKNLKVKLRKKPLDALETLPKKIRNQILAKS